MDLEKEKDVLKELHRFLEETLTEPSTEKEKNIHVLGPAAFMPPQMVSLGKDWKVLQVRAYIGTIKKNRFEPSHAAPNTVAARRCKSTKRSRTDGTEAVNI